MSKAKETDVLIIIIDTHDRLLFISGRYNTCIGLFENYLGNSIVL